MVTCKSLANNYDNGDNGNYNDDDTNSNVDDSIGNNNNIDGNEDKDEGEDKDKDEDDANNNNNNNADEEENHNGFGVNSDSDPPHYDHYNTSNFMGGQLEWEASSNGRPSSVNIVNIMKTMPALPTAATSALVHIWAQLFNCINPSRSMPRWVQNPRLGITRSQFKPFLLRWFLFIAVFLAQRLRTLGQWRR